MPYSTYYVEYGNSYSTLGDLTDLAFLNVCFRFMSLNVAERFRERLAMVRKAQGITQEELESRIGKSQSEKGYISRLETGGIDTPPFEMIQKIADALQVDPIEFFFAEGLDQSSEELIRCINALLSGKDAQQLRKIYRLLLVNLEKYTK